MERKKAPSGDATFAVGVKPRPETRRIQGVPPEDDDALPLLEDEVLPLLDEEDDVLPELDVLPLDEEDDVLPELEELDVLPELDELDDVLPELEELDDDDDVFPELDDDDDVFPELDALPLDDDDALPLEEDDALPLDELEDDELGGTQFGSYGQTLSFRIASTGTLESLVPSTHQTS